MTFFAYMEQHKTVCTGADGDVARLALHSPGAPVESGELADWTDWLHSIHGTDSLADGLMKCWWQWKDFEAGTVVDRCPLCGSIPKYHVADIYESGQRKARVWICEVHGFFTFAGDKRPAFLKAINNCAELMIHFGKVSQIY